MTAGTVGATSLVAMVALVKVFIRALAAGFDDVHPQSVFHTTPGRRTGLGICQRDPQNGKASALGEPERDLALGGLGGIRAVNQVELGLQAEIAADGSGRGLLDRV